jgi:hypothetical protein
MTYYNSTSNTCRLQQLGVLRALRTTLVARGTAQEVPSPELPDGTLHPWASQAGILLVAHLAI